MDTKELLVARYRELTAKRDAINEQAKPLQAQLDEINAESERLRVAAMDKKADIEALRDGPAWLDLKREIGILANVLYPPGSASKG